MLPVGRWDVSLLQNELEDVSGLFSFGQMLLVYEEVYVAHIVPGENGVLFADILWERLDISAEVKII